MSLTLKTTIFAKNEINITNYEQLAIFDTRY